MTVEPRVCADDLTEFSESLTDESLGMSSTADLKLSQALSRSVVVMSFRSEASLFVWSHAFSISDTADW